MSSQKSFKVAEEGRKRVSERKVATEEWSERDASSPALNIEKGATSQGIGATSRSWARQGNGLTPRAVRRKAVL